MLKILRMKTLYLLRHAKASSDYPGLADFDRPLTERGYADAHMVSKKLFEKGVTLDVLISSASVRTMSTALVFSINLKFPVDKIQIKKKLYDTPVNEYLKCIAEISEGNSLLLAGHNETITEVAQKLSKQRVIEMKTCSIIALEFDAESWKECVHLKGNQVFHMHPDVLKNE